MAQEKSFLLASTLRPVEVGSHFPKVPPHVTFVPWFTISPQNETSLKNRLDELARSYDPIDIIGGDEAMFGHDRDIRVRRVESGTLAGIHQQLLGLVGSLGGLHRQNWIGKEFKPHVTYIDGAGLDRDQHVALGALQLLSRLSVSGERTVEASYLFHRGS